MVRQKPGELAGITLFALKSARGVAVGEAQVERWGLRGDRRWGVVHPDGSRLRGRETPRIMAVTATPAADGGLRLEAAGHDPVVVHPPTGPAVAVEDGAFLDVPFLTPNEDPAADAWLSAVVGTPLRLVWQDDPTKRPIDPEHGGTGEPGDVVGLQDLGPLHLTSAASLRRFDEVAAELAVERGDGLPEPLDMRRFRPNVVVDGFEPFAEDGWTTLTIGDVGFRVTQRCDRCAVTLYDPETVVRGKEPLRTLARFRRWDGVTWFGVRVAPTGTGTIRLGDPVAVTG